MQEALREWVAEQVGAIAKPDEIRFSDNLPKTRSGKIMRRLLRAIARDEAITQDISTLEDESIISNSKAKISLDSNLSKNSSIPNNSYTASKILARTCAMNILENPNNVPMHRQNIYHQCS